MEQPTDNIHSHGPDRSIKRKPFELLGQSEENIDTRIELLLQRVEDLEARVTALEP